LAEVVLMRGRQDPQGSMLAFIDVETRVPVDHPLIIIKRFADAALAESVPGYKSAPATVHRVAATAIRSPIGPVCATKRAPTSQHAAG
jgi:hypothetical protein